MYHGHHRFEDTIDPDAWREEPDGTSFQRDKCAYAIVHAIKPIINGLPAFMIEEVMNVVASIIAEETHVTYP